MQVIVDYAVHYDLSEERGIERMSEQQKANAIKQNVMQILDREIKVPTNDDDFKIMDMDFDGIDRYARQRYGAIDNEYYLTVYYQMPEDDAKNFESYISRFEYIYPVRVNRVSTNPQRRVYWDYGCSEIVTIDVSTTDPDYEAIEYVVDKYNISDDEAYTLAVETY